MGSETNNISCYIYKIKENYNKETTDYYAVFDKTPFAHGSFRFCYKGEIRNKSGKISKSEIFPSGKCVVKVFKEKVAYHLSDFNEDFKSTFYSMQISELFNSSHNYYCPEIHFMPPYATILYKHSAFELFGFIPIRDDDSMKKIKNDEWLAIEPYMEGDYKKFISNTGLYYDIKDDEEVISFFMHWNWVQSKGEKIVSDIQGIKKYNYYELTDPAIQSINEEYGPTDLGIFGLIAFLIRHKHNKFCKDLPWPKSEYFNKLLEYTIPTQRSTKYIWEIRKLYEDKKEIVEEFYLELRDSVFYKSKTKTSKRRCLIF